MKTKKLKKFIRWFFSNNDNTEQNMEKYKSKKEALSREYFLKKNRKIRNHLINKFS